MNTSALFHRMMVPMVVIAILNLLPASSLLHSQLYRKYFTDKTMRVDYYHTGTKGAESFSLNEVYEEGSWPGSIINLIDTLNLGEYQIRVYDQATAAMIFSVGYSTMFNEWQATDEAASGVNHTFSETVRLPFPQSTIQLTINRRDKRSAFHEIFSVIIDPNSNTQVNREQRETRPKTISLMDNGSPHDKVDLLILGDGYRKEDLDKFRRDARHFNDVLFSTSPFKEMKNRFNVRALETASLDSGIDKPDKNIWKRTALGARYNTFGSARYVLTEENKALRDIAGSVPYDFLLILVNDNRYGGGGIYNLYTTCYSQTDASGMEWQMDYVYVHEFGHSFGGLGDEYYSPGASDLYEKGIEPWEPNLTALIDKSHLKWNRLAEGGTPLPTPWDKQTFDSLQRERTKLDRLAPDYYRKREPIYQAQEKILKTSRFSGTVGAFEGAGYMSEGLYRPSVDCRMFSLSLVDFDPVCSASIIRVIDFYSH